MLDSIRDLFERVGRTKHRRRDLAGLLGRPRPADDAFRVDVSWLSWVGRRHSVVILQPVEAHTAQRSRDDRDSSRRYRDPFDWN